VLNCGVYFQLRALEVGGANDILHMLFSAKGLDNKVIVFSLVCYATDVITIVESD